jgi:hypothetical protein
MRAGCPQAYKEVFKMRGRISRKPTQLEAGRRRELHRWLWCAPAVVFVAATVLVAFYGCGGGGGGGNTDTLSSTDLTRH